MNELSINHMNTKSLNGFWALNIPSLMEERWRIVDEGDQWAVWFIPKNHPEHWRELANFSTEAEAEAVDYVKSM